MSNDQVCSFGVWFRLRNGIPLRAWPSMVDAPVALPVAGWIPNGNGFRRNSCGSHGAEGTLLTPFVTASYPRKPPATALPTTPAEQIESTQQAFEAGATIAHIHVRNPDESPSSDPALFAQVQEGLRKHCPGMIVQFSTGGRGRDQAARGSSLSLRPDMASLSTGCKSAPKWDPSRDWANALKQLQKSTTRWGPDRRRSRPHPE